MPAGQPRTFAIVRTSFPNPMRSSWVQLQWRWSVEYEDEPSRIPFVLKGKMANATGARVRGFLTLVTAHGATVNMTRSGCTAAPPTSRGWVHMTAVLPTLDHN
jgi:hypothetical protein